MKEDYIETMLKFYALGAKATFGEDAIVVLNGGTPGMYENNPTINEYVKNGYKLCDANMFGRGEERFEALTFCKEKLK